MNHEPTLTIEQALALSAILNSGSISKPDPKTQNESGDGRIVIVRSRDAGVLFGEYAGRDGANVHLKNAVQMWQWFAAQGGTLIDCAVFGVTSKKCKFSVASASITVLNACAIIDCSTEGAASLRSVVGGTWA